MSHSFLTTGEECLEGDLGDRGKIRKGSSAKWLKGIAEEAVMSNEALCLCAAVRSELQPQVQRNAKRRVPTLQDLAR